MRPKHTMVQMFCEKHLENISDLFRNLYKDEKLADVTLYCREGSLRVHKLILAASSSYFQKIFLETKNENPIIFMHGISLDELKNLVDLMYKGAADIPADDIDNMYDIVEELQLIGILQDESRVPNCDTPSKRQSRTRETRYRGMKRVAIDYSEDEPYETTPSRLTRSTEMIANTELPSVALSDTASTIMPDIGEPVAQGNNDEETAVSKRMERAMQKSDFWSKKPRKYKCALCTSSFKRASHLTRHQLVHTGERPYSCNHCDKAFSRHDKLKHHIRKAHEDIDLYNTISPSEWTGHIQTCEPRNRASQLSQSSLSDDQTMTDVNSHEEGVEQPLMDAMYETIEPVIDGAGSQPAKKRGRPRKYPKELMAALHTPRNYPRRSKQPDSVEAQWKIISSATLDLIKQNKPHDPLSLKEILRSELGRNPRGDEPAKKKRGRKKKAATIGQQTTGDGQPIADGQPGSTPAVKKRRGRKPKDPTNLPTGTSPISVANITPAADTAIEGQQPMATVTVEPKQLQEQSATAEPQSSNVASNPVLPKLRGRKPKNYKDGQPTILSMSALIIKKKPGRKPGSKNKVTPYVDSSVPVPKRRGRKPKCLKDARPKISGSSTLVIKKRRGRKPGSKNKESQSSDPMNQKPGPKRRGRKPKLHKETQNSCMDSAVVAPKRRGRKPKNIKDATVLSRSPLVIKKKRGRKPGSKNKDAPNLDMLAETSDISSYTHPAVSLAVTPHIPVDPHHSQLPELQNLPNIGLRSVGRNSQGINHGQRNTPTLTEITQFRVSVPQPLVKRGRGRPRVRPVQHKADNLHHGGLHPGLSQMHQSTQPKAEQYDYTNLPFGDIEYLTRPLREPNEENKPKSNVDRSLHHEVVLEPVVEIKTEPEDRDEMPEDGEILPENITITIPIRTQIPLTPPIPLTAPLPQQIPLPAETTLMKVSSSVLETVGESSTSNQAGFDKQVVETTKLAIRENQVAKIGECTVSVAKV